MCAVTAVPLRRRALAVLLALICMAEVTMGPGFCDPAEHGGEGGNRAVTR